MFLLDGQDVLQLTKLDRSDTTPQVLLGSRAIFTASADLFGANRDRSCQLFSISRTGDDLRQLTTFSGSGGNCTFGTPECYIDPVFADEKAGTLVFMSSCTVDATRPSSAQIFTIDVDGRHLRQLTALSGFRVDADGAEVAELPGPIAYESARR